MKNRNKVVGKNEENNRSCGAKISRKAGSEPKRLPYALVVARAVVIAAYRLETLTYAHNHVSYKQIQFVGVGYCGNHGVVIAVGLVNGARHVVQKRGGKAGKPLSAHGGKPAFCNFQINFRSKRYFFKRKFYNASFKNKERKQNYKAYCLPCNRSPSGAFYAHVKCENKQRVERGV